MTIRVLGHEIMAIVGLHFVMDAVPEILILNHNLPPSSPHRPSPLNLSPSDVTLYIYVVLVCLSQVEYNKLHEA